MSPRRPLDDEDRSRVPTLRDAIEDGRYRPGEHLRVARLMQDLG